MPHGAGAEAPRSVASQGSTPKRNVKSVGIGRPAWFSACEKARPQPAAAPRSARTGRNGIDGAVPQAHRGPLIVRPTVRGFFAAIAVAAAAATAGCGGGEDDGAATSMRDQADPGPTACTRASCTGGALVRLRRVPENAASADVCVDARCAAISDAIRDDVRVALPPEPRSGGRSVRRADATVEVRDDAGAVVARGSSPIWLTAVRPNGPRCTPTCWTGEATVELQLR